MYLDIAYAYQTSQSDLQIGMKGAHNVKVKLLVKGSCINILTMQYKKLKQINKSVVKKL